MVNDNSLKESLRELQLETNPIIAFLLVFVASPVLLLITRDENQLYIQDILVGIMFLVAWCSWRFRYHYPMGTWILIIGLSIIIIIAQLLWYPTTNVCALLVLPSILSTAYLSTKDGIAFGFVVSILLYIYTFIIKGDLSTGAVLVSLGAIWGGIALVWAALRPLRIVTAESWHHYSRYRKLLEESRDLQLELNQANDFLKNAYKETRRLNQIVIASERAAEEARKAKEAFVANVSHELRTPLNMIIGFSSMIAMTPLLYRRKLPGQLLADIAAIQRNAEHLSKLVDDVLDLSKADAGFMKLSIANCSIKSVIDEAVQSAKNLFDAKGLWIKIEIAPDLPDIPCDKTRIRQVILNLLSNAGRFVEQGGVQISARRDNAKVIVSVNDTGPGISEEDIDRLFEPFRQLEISYLENKGGTGLGLAISKKLVELHGGNMWVESKLDVGSNFCFSLPIFKPGQIVGNASRWILPQLMYRDWTQSRKIELPKVNKRVLFVDPEGNFSSLAADYYKNDIEVALVRTMGEAVAEFDRSPAQLLVLNQTKDSALVDMGKTLKKLPFTIPVIVCSAPGVCSAASNLGVSKYLIKPVSREVLLQAVGSVPTPVETILIVDDEPEALQLFSRMLSSHPKKYTLLRAGDGQRAMEIIRSGHPDLILLDLIMPGLNGFQILSLMKQDPCLSDIPIIAITAQDPIGEPVTSDKITIIRSNGFSRRELLDTILTLSQVVTPYWTSGNQELSDMPLG